MLCHVEDSLISEILKNFVLPFGVGAVSFILFRKLDDWKNRRMVSILGVATMESLIEEVKTGIAIMELFDRNRSNFMVTVPPPALPKATWYGIQTIGDETLLRIIKLSKNKKFPGLFELREIRIHCKNYFEHMALSWNTAADATKDWRSHGIMLIDGKFIEAAQSVLQLLIKAKELLELNSKKYFPS